MYFIIHLPSTNTIRNISFNSSSFTFVKRITKSYIKYSGATDLNPPLTNCFPIKFTWTLLDPAKDGLVRKLYPFSRELHRSMIEFVMKRFPLCVSPNSFRFRSSVELIIELSSLYSNRLAVNERKMYYTTTSAFFFKCGAVLLYI